MSQSLQVISVVRGVCWELGIKCTDHGRHSLRAIGQAQLAATEEEEAEGEVDGHVAAVGDGVVVVDPGPEHAAGPHDPQVPGASHHHALGQHKDTHCLLDHGAPREVSQGPLGDCDQLLCEVGQHVHCCSIPGASKPKKFIW